MSFGKIQIQRVICDCYSYDRLLVYGRDESACKTRGMQSNCEVLSFTKANGTWKGYDFFAHAKARE